MTAFDIFAGFLLTLAACVAAYLQGVRLPLYFWMLSMGVFCVTFAARAAWLLAS